MSRPDSSEPAWIGVDLGANAVRSVLVRWRRGEPVTISSDEAAVMSSTPHHLIARIALIAYDYGAGHRGVTGLGVAFPGGVDPDTGTTGVAAGLPGQWQGLRMRDLLIGLTGLPTVIVDRSDPVDATPAGSGALAPAVGAALLARRLARLAGDEDSSPLPSG